MRARLRARRGLAALAALLGLATLTGAVTAAPPAAAEAAPCTAWGTLPARVSIGSAHTAVPTTLQASGCALTGHEDSAAYLWSATKAVDVPVWNYVGDRFVFDLPAGSYPPGTYSLRDGIVLLTDPANNWVDVGWRTTSMTVKLAGQVAVSATRAGTLTTVRATLLRFFPADAHFHGLANVTAYVDRATPNHSDWVTVASRVSDAYGRIAAGYRTDRHWVYRVRFATTAAVWGAASGRAYA